jgi:hypothetical protein
MKNKSTIKSVTPLSMSNWNELVLQNADYSIFHSKEWCQLLDKTYGYKPCYIILPGDTKFNLLIPMMEVNSIITGNRIVSLPFSDYCEPFSQEFTFDEILNQLKSLYDKRNYKYIELRGGNYPFTSLPYSKGYVHKIDLTLGEERIYNNIRSSNKRNIKKASREHIKIKFSKDERSINDFYKLNILTRKRHGLPPQPFLFFKNINEILMSKGFCEIAESIYRGKVIASSVLLTFGKKVLYKFGASDYKFQNLRANDLLFWEAIRHYSELGYEEFCFGRTSEESESLRRFKLGWGAREQSLNYYRYNLKREKFECNNNFTLKSPKETGYHNFVFRNSPKSLLKFIGNITYRHIG